MNYRIGNAGDMRPAQLARAPSAYDDSPMAMTGGGAEGTERREGERRAQRRTGGHGGGAEGTALA